MGIQRWSMRVTWAEMSAPDVTQHQMYTDLQEECGEGRDLVMQQEMLCRGAGM